MSIYIPNIDANQFNKICEEKGLKFIYVSIPTPHGRLKDADKLIKYLDDKYWDSPWIRSTALSIFEQEIKNAPTIIEAEEEG